MIYVYHGIFSCQEMFKDAQLKFASNILKMKYHSQMDYKTFFESDLVQKYAKSICEIARECWNLQLSDSTGFSISQVLPDTDIVLVDKSGTGFRRNKINVDDLLLINLKGELLYQPSIDNPRLAPVNTAIHLAGYQSSDAKGCIHWHDPYTNAFACYGKTIHPLTLQSKLLGDVPCVMIDDREEKSNVDLYKGKLAVPSGFHSREDVYYVMNKVGNAVGAILNERNSEFQRHGVSVTHYEHGLFAFGRSVEEAFENGYRTVRNAQTIINSRMLLNYPDEKSLNNAGAGDATMIIG
jgi:ribulose-5-phosphate 4-epimerase/fuculose-1-phosphate aldolase